MRSYISPFIQDSIWNEDVQLISESEENQETHPLENSRWEETINKGINKM